MNRKIIVVFIVLFITFIFGISFYYIINSNNNFLKNKYSINEKDVNSIMVTMKMEDYRKKQLEINVELKDKSLIEKILTNIEKANIDNVKLDFKGIYKVDLKNGISFIFDSDSDENGYIELDKNGEKSIVKFDPILLYEIANLANEEYKKTLTVADTLKSTEIKIYTITTDYTMYNEITDLEQIDKILNQLKELNFIPLKTEEIENDNDFINSISYQIDLGGIYFYIDKNFENAILESLYENNNEIWKYFKVSESQKLKEFIPDTNADEKFQIIEAKWENNLSTQAKLELYVKDKSLNSTGITLLDYMENTPGRAEYYKNNDFVIYKKNNEGWEELPSFAETDKNVVNKTGNMQAIDWSEKYGELTTGIYKLERSIYFGNNIGYITDNDIESKYYVIFKIN